MKKLLLKIIFALLSCIQAYSASTDLTYLSPERKKYLSAHPMPVATPVQSTQPTAAIEKALDAIEAKTDLKMQYVIKGNHLRLYSKDAKISLTGNVEGTDTAEPMFHIKSLYVNNRFQNKGIEDMMFNILFHPYVAHYLKYRKVAGTPTDDYTKRLYEALGFVSVDNIPAWKWVKSIDID